MENFNASETSAAGGTTGDAFHGSEDADLLSKFPFIVVAVT